MTVAGHHQTCQEERRASALQLIEHTKESRQQAREFSSYVSKKSTKKGQFRILVPGLQIQNLTVVIWVI